ncbi:hypothetical protein QTO34_000714 [Cnephaeus nilssonii]|uniref:Uncharacterized protein n=1 Tax=Cnephaeus nilssonii TaxID=3371016 RepID=A0AA40IBX9_CNENI|nr:hypothetical protein QTO34_000714 [Eptesicus nilssonii]
MNWTPKQAMVKLCQETTLPWTDILPIVLLWVRCAPRARVGFTPFEILYGRLPSLNLAKGIFGGNKELRNPEATIRIWKKLSLKSPDGLLTDYPSLQEQLYTLINLETRFGTEHLDPPLPGPRVGHELPGSQNTSHSWPTSLGAEQLGVGRQRLEQGKSRAGDVVPKLWHRLDQSRGGGGGLSKPQQKLEQSLSRAGGGPSQATAEA